MSLESTQRNQNFDDEQPINLQYRVRYHFGELELTSEWNPDPAPVENFAEQLRREQAAHDITIEKQTEVRF